MSSKNELGRCLEKELKLRGWSQHRLAREAGISQAQISRIINFEPRDNLEKICGNEVASALARALGINEIYVFRLARILTAPRRTRNFSTWLVGELLLLDITQEELAERSNIEPGALAELFKGVTPNIEALKRISPVLNREVTDLMDIAGLYTEYVMSDFEVASEEINVLELYRKLSTQEREFIKGSMELLLKTRRK